MFAIGFVTAFVVALLAIKFFLQIIKRISFVPFAIYRFILAAMVYWSWSWSADRMSSAALAVPMTSESDRSQRRRRA